jgi:hypothetical protein
MNMVNPCLSVVLKTALVRLVKTGHYLVMVAANSTAAKAPDQRRQRAKNAHPKTPGKNEPHMMLANVSFYAEKTANHKPMNCGSVPI